jgi:hypothetical protein
MRLWATSVLISPPPDDLANTVAFTIDRGRRRLAAYNTDDWSCTKKPLATLVSINPNAGDRVYLFAFGYPNHGLELLAVPIPSA